MLKLGHENLLSGHQRAQKTAQRILMNFHWIGVHGDVQRYCASCDACQRTVGKGTVTRAPLQRMPLVSVPFEKVAIDQIGPLHPVSGRGHRWILTLEDFATRYPEAVPLKSTETEVVAEALLGIFSRVGFPQVVLSDNGPQFVFHVMKAVARLIVTVVGTFHAVSPPGKRFVRKVEWHLEKDASSHDYRKTN